MAYPPPGSYPPPGAYPPPGSYPVRMSFLCFLTAPFLIPIPFSFVLIFQRLVPCVRRFPFPGPFLFFSTHLFSISFLRWPTHDGSSFCLWLCVWRTRTIWCSLWPLGSHDARSTSDVSSCLSCLSSIRYVHPQTNKWFFSSCLISPRFLLQGLHSSAPAVIVVADRGHSAYPHHHKSSKFGKDLKKGGKKAGKGIKHAGKDMGKGLKHAGKDIKKGFKKAF